MSPAANAPRLDRISPHVPWPPFPDELPGWVSQRLPFRKDRWKRMCQGLFLLSTGRNCVPELTAVLGSRLALSAQSGSLAVLFRQYLPDAGLANYTVLPYFRQGLGVCWLTDLGREVCTALGWQARTSEWERLLSFHSGESQPEHSAMVLAMAHEARKRGFRVIVCPQLAGPAQPDLFLSDQKNGRAFLEVERDRHAKPAKWRNMLTLQGFAAVCALTPASRERLTAQIKELGLPGRATDLETLRAAKDPSKLWLEVWRK